MMPDKTTRRRNSESLAVKSILKRIWSEDEGVLTFEWVLLITVAIIGIIGGYSAMRDAVIDEMGDIAEGVISIDQSFSTAAPACCPGVGSWGSFEDNDPAPHAERGRLFDAKANHPPAP